MPKMQLSAINFYSLTIILFHFQDEIESRGAVVFDYTDLLSDPGKLLLSVHLSHIYSGMIVTVATPQIYQLHMYITGNYNRTIHSEELLFFAYEKNKH